MPPCTEYLSYCATEESQVYLCLLDHSACFRCRPDQSLRLQTPVLLRRLTSRLFYMHYAFIPADIAVVLAVRYDA